MTSQHPTDAPVSQGDLVSIAPPVCERLLGEPSSRSSREWRWGRKGSFRLKLDTGTWSDFEAEEGGGVLALVMREQRLDKAGALAWLEQQHRQDILSRNGACPLAVLGRLNTKNAEPGRRLNLRKDVDAAAFEQVYGSFRDFHAYFAPLFGRRETREHSGHYLQALLVQSGERRNAENLSETVPGSARGMQRFLTDSPWDDEVIIGRLQEYLGTRLEHPEGVWVLDGSDFPKQGRKSVGVARQYCGRLGKVANCQAGMFLAYVSPLGRALVDKGLYLPESWTSDKDRCEAAGVPEDRQGYRSKTELALEMVGRAQERGHLKAGWVAADDAFGMSPSFREGLAALGMWYVLDVPSGFTLWPPEPAWTSAEYQGFGRPRKPRLRDGQRRTMEQRSDELPEEAWREITVAEGSQGPRSYLFSAQRVRPTSRRKPGEIHWAVYRRNRDGSEPRYYLSNAPEDTPLETLAYVGGSRWRIETEFETEKSDVGLDEYETRTWAGWHHHVALCLLGGAFLLSLQQAWGEKDAPDHEAAGLPGGAGNAAPGTVRANRVAAVA